MNRAILIVICDFLVSSMLSMMTGMVPAHTGGTGVGLDEATTRMLLAELETQRADLVKLRQKLREAAEKLGNSPEQDAEMRRLTAELAKKIRQIQELKESQKRTAETTGKMTPQQLKSLLDHEAELRISAELRLHDKQEDLSSAKQDLKQLQSTVATSSEKIAELSKEYMKTQKQLADTSARAQVQQKELSAKEQDLAGAKAALKEINARMGRLTNEKQTLQNTLAYTSGKLNTAERDAADYKGQVVLLQRTLAEQKMELAIMRRQKDDMQLLVKRSVADASQTRQALDVAKKEAEASRKAAMDDKVKRQVAEGRMKDMERQLRNDVLSSYSAGVLHLETILEEKRLLGTSKGGGSYYLPVVAVGKRKLLVGSLGQLAGDAEHPMVFQKVTRLEHLVTIPNRKVPPARIAGPLLVSKREPRIAAPQRCLVPVQPLRIITAEALKKRGVQNLYLFQAGDFGKSSAELAGRCSLDFSGATPKLFIRNPAKSTANVLSAQEGDLILTKEGDLVGIVVNKTAYDLRGRGEDARVVLFDSREEWNNVTALPFAKDKDGYCKAFGDGMKKIRDNVR